MTDLEIYDDIKSQIFANFRSNQQAKYVLTHGGCYWFADTLHHYIPGSVIVMSRLYQHCGIRINNKVYDATGCISDKSFTDCSEKDILYMKKHFVPKFDTSEIVIV